MLALETIEAQRQKLRAQLAELDARENTLRVKFGMEPIPTKRHRLTNEDVSTIRAGILGAMNPGQWMSVSEIMVCIPEQINTGYDSEDVKRQIRALDDDTSSPIAHNRKRGRASRYALMNDDGSLPAVPKDAARFNSWVLSAFIGFRKAGEILVKMDDVCDKLFEHPAFEDMSVADMIDCVRATPGIHSNGLQGEGKERFFLTGK